MQAERLGPECARRWNKYLAAESAGVHSERAEALSAFISLANEQSPASLTQFVTAWCIANLDGYSFSAHRHGGPFRLPLLREIIFPFLLAGRSAGADDHSRWLAQLWHLLARETKCRARLSEVGGPVALLEEALAHDSTDERARRLLVAALVDSINFSLHELPALLASEVELRMDLDRLRALGPVGYDAENFWTYLTAAREVVEGDRSEGAIDAYFDALKDLGASG